MRAIISMSVMLAVEDEGSLAASPSEHGYDEWDASSSRLQELFGAE